MLIKSQSMHTAYELVLCIASTVLSRIAITFYAICCLDHGQREPINQTKGPSRKQQRRRRPTVPRPTLVSPNIGNVWIHPTPVNEAMERCAPFTFDDEVHASCMKREVAAR